MNTFNRICVFCGSQPGVQAIYRQQAVALGDELVKRRIALVYGGGSIGLMGVIAQTVLDGGLPVLGIIPRALRQWEQTSGTIGDELVVVSMEERKAQMAARSDGFVILPGGFGTMDELFEMATWGQLGIQQKSIGILNVAGYFDDLLRWIDNAIAQGFIRAHHRDLFVSANSPAELLDAMQEHTPPAGLVDWGVAQQE